MRVDFQFNLRRPPNALAVGLENRLAERQLDAMKQAPQSRAAGLTGTLGPQQRGYDVTCHGAPGLGEMDHERKTLAQLQLDRAVVTVDLRKTERLKREPSHESSLAPSASRGTRRGLSSGNSRFRLGPPYHSPPSCTAIVFSGRSTVLCATHLAGGSDCF